MAGIKALRKIQIGSETTAGTTTAATALWRGLGTIEDRRETKFPQEDIGYISGVDRTYVPQLLAALSMDAVPATFEQLPYIFEAGIKAVGTGAADGVGSGKVYTYTGPTTALNTIRTYTLEGGDNTEAERMEYSFVEAFKLTGKPKEALMMSADWLGRQVTLNAFTGAIALPTIEDILFSKAKLYLDAVGGTIGTTQLTNTFMGMELTVKTGWRPVFTADGNLYFSFAKLTPPEVLCKVTFEHDASGQARKVDWRAQTPRLLRISFLGNALTTNGTTYNNKTLNLDMAAKIEKVDKLDEIDGNDVLKVSFRIRNNATGALFFKAVVVNELASLT